MRNLSYENEYDLHSNGLVSKTHFHMKGFALGLVLKQRQKRTRKWPIASSHFNRSQFWLHGCEALFSLLQVNWDPKDNPMRETHQGLEIGTWRSSMEVHQDAIFDDVII